MRIDSPPAGFEALEGMETFNYGHLPAVAAYCRRLGLVELVNEMVPSEMALRPGIVVQAMVLDTLSGRSPLYRIKDFQGGTLEDYYGAGGSGNGGFCAGYEHAQL